jgi:hypothetical protein
VNIRKVSVQLIVIPHNIGNHMTFGYPKYGKSQTSGRTGESFIDYFVHYKLQWIYRSTHQESDFGIDGYIDIVTDECVTGQTIGVQVKCGNSYYDKKSSGGIHYDGKKKHLNYYLNSPYPIILLVLNSDCSKGCWVEFNANITSPSKNGWWIEVPETNVLNLSAKEKWESVVGPVTDYSDQVASSWRFNEILDESSFGTYIVHKEAILACEFKGIRGAIDRLSRNREALIKNRGTLEVLISGFDDDPREVYEIPEIRNWYSESIRIGIPWFYFLGNHFDGMGLNVLLLAYCDVVVKYKESGNTCVEIIDTKRVVQWLKQNFHNLNQFASDKNIPDEINMEMSQQAYMIVSGILPILDS